MFTSFIHNSLTNCSSIVELQEETKGKRKKFNQKLTVYVYSYHKVKMNYLKFGGY